VCVFVVCVCTCVCVCVGVRIDQCSYNQKCYVSDTVSTTTLSPVDTTDLPVDFNASKYAIVILPL